MTPQTVNVPPAKFHTRTVMIRSALVCLLGLSFAVGLSVAASNPGVIGAFLDLLASSFLILCPICAKGSGNRAIITLGAITATAAAVGLFFKLAIGENSSTWAGDAAWGLIQIAIVGLAIGANPANTV